MPKHKKFKIPLIHPAWHVLLAFLLFVLSVVVSRSSDLLAWEETLFLWIYNWPVFLTPIFLVITQFGSIYVLAIISLFLSIKKKFNMLLRLLLASILAYQLSGFAKDLWGRTRPNELLVEVVNRDYFRGPGFPSGHAALATAMAFVVGHYLPKKYHWLVPVWIIGVALSRIYLGIHAPLDIVGGFAIGWFSYMLFRQVRLQPVKHGSRRKKKKIH
jgi:undecaprenyl-diphosphatase